MIKKAWVLMFCWLGAAWADIPEYVKMEVDQRVTHGMNPSIVLGLYENGSTQYHVQGKASSDAPATTDSVYEIGSISKTFTGLLLAQAVLDETIDLDGAVAAHLKAIDQLQDSTGQDITFKHLTTHTAGFPRLPGNLNAFSKDPYADYDHADLMAATLKLKPRPAGENYLYSNFAVGLLGETLAEAQQSSFNELVQAKILNPLHLKHTYLTLDAVPEALLATGHQGKVPAQPWSFQALAGAGSIRSSIKDLMAYGIAHLQHPNPQLHAAMQKAQEPLHDQGHMAVGMGWHISNGIIWHNGGTMGFRSILMIDPKNHRVAAGITNAGQSDVEDLVSHLMNSEAQIRKHDFPVPIESTQLPAFEGRFKNPDSGQEVAISLDKGNLFFRPEKQPRQKLQYIGDDRFKVVIVKAKLSFKRDQSGEVTGFNFKGLGSEQTYLKVD